MGLGFKKRRKRRGKRKDERQADRAGRKQARWDAKQSRIDRRMDAKETAYKAGLNPTSWVGDVVGEVGDVAKTYLNNNQGEQKDQVPPTDDNSTLMLVGLAAGAYYLSQK